MAQVTATIASKVGLHARPAATFVKAVAEKGVPVTIAKEGGAAVDASSILGVMTLGAGFGDVVTLASDADGAAGGPRGPQGPPGDRPGRLRTGPAGRGALHCGACPSALRRRHAPTMKSVADPP